MTDEALRQLLRNADAAAGSAPSTSSDLAARVQKRLRRRRQTQMGGVSLVLCAMVAVGVMMQSNLNTKPANVARSSQAKTELALIRLEADSQAATVNRMIQYQKSLDVRTAARKFENEPRERLQEQREKAARLLTQDGEYRRVIQLFPETHWASIARQRLQT